MNDELTPREHSEMKDLVLAGSQRIRPAGRHRSQLIAGALALVLVAGVAGGAIATAALLGSEAQPAPAVTTTELAPVPTELVAPTPTPTPTTPLEPTTPPALDDLVVSPAGLGPMHIGEPLTGAGALMAQSTDDDCSMTYWRTAEQYIVADGGYGGQGGEAFTVWGDESGAIQRIDVLTSSIPTTEGLRVGMTTADVLRLYPDAVEQRGAVSTIWVVPGPGSEGQLIIEVAGPDAATRSAGPDAVVFLRVVGAAASPGAISASDDVVGFCTDSY